MITSKAYCQDVTTFIKDFEIVPFSGVNSKTNEKFSCSIIRALISKEIEDVLEEEIFLPVKNVDDKHLLATFMPTNKTSKLKDIKKNLVSFIVCQKNKDSEDKTIKFCVGNKVIADIDEKLLKSLK